MMQWKKLLVVAAIVLGPRVADACTSDSECRGGRVCEDGRCVGEVTPAPVRPETTIESVPIRGLWVSGLVIWSVTYVTGIIAAAAISTAAGSEIPGAHVGAMAAPLAGPWIEAAGVVEPETRAGLPGFVVLGTLQACGALMAFLGASLHHDVVVTRPSIQSFGIAPVHGGWALSLGGTF